MAYVGKFTGRYMEREMVEFFAAARQLRPDLLFLTLTQSDPEVMTREFDRLGIPPADHVVTRARPDDVGRYLAAADFGICFYQPKFSEIAASPTKLGEYLGAGLPVVASAVGGLLDLIEHGRTGLLVEPGNPNALADALRRLLANRTGAAQIGERARARVQQRYSFERMVTAFQELYLAGLPARSLSGARRAQAAGI
jgi:glycosyltransferase involved in cell wall biosynthesis